MTENKLEMSDVRVAEQDGPIPPSSPEEKSFLDKQTRTRQLFSFPQLFAFALMYFITWVGMATNMYYALLNGGPAAYVFNYLIVMAGVLAQACCFAELASIIPIAGAQYYWTWHFAPPKYRMFITWLQGWATWLGYVVLSASSLNSNAVVLQGIVQLNYPEYEVTGWRTCLIVIANLTFNTVVNIWFFPVVPWFELVSGVVNICFFIITLVALWVLSPRNDPSFIMTTANSSGWENSFIVWNLGLLTQVWNFVGLEGVIHMGEEAKNAKRTVPQAMVGAIALNGIMGLVMTITLVICMPPLEELLEAESPFVYLLEVSTGSKAIATVIASGIVLAVIGAGLPMISSTSRLTWAWARDGGLPAYFGHVDARTRVPIRAVALTVSICIALNFLNLGTETYVALGAVTSLSSLSLYFSYATILAVVLHARLTTGIKVSEWNLGRWGVPVNILALVYTLYAMIWLPFPTELPVTAENMNYCGPVFGAVMIGAVGAWFVWGRKHWEGPNKKIVEVVLRLASS